MDHRFAQRSKGAKEGLVGALILSALALAACAVVEAPPGGEVDLVPPLLIAATPDSNSLDLGPVAKFSFTFSEKMNRVAAGGWLHFYPPQKIRKTSWHGATRADVELENTLPADTVVVVEISADMKDAHKVSGFIERRYPVATGDSIFEGYISGALVMADSALSGGMVELYDIPPDSLRWDQQPLLRRTRCGPDGRFRLDWLPSPSGPYLLHGFADNDHNARLGEKEGSRVFPDTVNLTLQVSGVELEPLEIFPVDTPGDLLLSTRRPLSFTPAFVVFSQAITSSDTGWTPAVTPFDSLGFAFFDSTVNDTIFGLDPGPNRLILFADLDADSTLSVFADSLLIQSNNPELFAVSDSLGDTTGFYLEPWMTLEPVAVEPGLLVRFAIPEEPFVLVPMAKPVEVIATLGEDSLMESTTTDLAVSETDSTESGIASPDSLRLPSAATDTIAVPGVDND